MHVIQIDTSSPSSIKQTTDLMKEKYRGKLDILINNAGITTNELNDDAAKKSSSDKLLWN